MGTGDHHVFVRNVGGPLTEFTGFNLDQVLCGQRPLRPLLRHPHIEDRHQPQVGQRRKCFDTVNLVLRGHREHRQGIQGRRVGRRVGVLHRRQIVDRRAPQDELRRDVDSLGDLALLAHALNSEHPF